MSSDFFHNKTVWLTGASSGLGEGLAKALIRRGARLVLSARREAELQRVKNECVKFIPDKNILILPLDVSKMKPEEEVNKVLSHFGSVDVLINNAGIAQRSLVYNTPEENERKIMEVNFWGAVRLTKAVLPGMRKNQSGNIAVISSVMGKFGYPGTSSYAASKHALHGYFESLRFEEARNNIQIHLVCPGFIRSDVSLNALNEKGEKHGKMDEGQEKGMSPDTAAQKVLYGIEKNKKEYFFGGKELGAVFLRRFFPSVFYKTIEKVSRKK